jgi:hypothetical protein
MQKSYAVLMSCLFTLNSISINAQCLQGDCYNGVGYFKARNGSTYEGNFKSGTFHGKGSIYYSNNDKYTGSFAMGKKHGSGKYYFAGGHEYIGEFNNDKRQGRGKMIYLNKDEYRGEWLADEPQGQGIYLFGDGSKYEGGFANGNFDGSGKFTEASGESYLGTWNNNVLLSKNDNTITKIEEEKPQPAKLSSHQKANVKNQRMKDCTNQYCNAETGKFLYRDGSYYIGDFTNGEATGEGTCTYINGDVYKGGWKNHGPHGIGTMYSKEGGIHSGIWEYGSLKKRSYENEALAKINIVKEEKKYNDNVDIYAVVVGVATYSHMPSLRYTDDDAYHLYAFLKSPEGGAIPDDHISILIDDAAYKKNIMQAISSTFSKADANDVIMLYMSGHGLPGAFVPVDFDGINNQLSYDDILNLIEASPAKHKLYITDACHSGSMYAYKTPYELPEKNFYSKFTTTKGGTAVITSSKTDELSLEYSGMRHGVFSHYLIEGLKGDANKNNDNIISVQELFDYIYLNVRHHTKSSQTPSIHGNYDVNMPVAMIR